MKERELNRATIGVVNRTDIRGRATADEMNRSLRTGKQRSFWRITSLTFLGSLTVAGLLIVVAPLPARADHDEDSRHGHEDNDKGIRAEITVLQAQVASLQTTVSTLQNEVNSLKTSNTALENQLSHAKNVLALDPFVRVDPHPEIGVKGPNITFSGANIHIVSGSGATDDHGNPTGLGNLIIGYDEAPASLNPGQRGGSHNLIVGAGHRFLFNVFGGLLAGENNTLTAAASSIVGGNFNTASYLWTSVLGGQNNTASLPNATVSGGEKNTASGQFASVSGGFSNTASGTQSSVSGGALNIASDGGASVLGGYSNTANSFNASISGGFFNTASGFEASVLGGARNTAGGNGTVVIGGQNVTDNTNFSIAPQPPFP